MPTIVLDRISEHHFISSWLTASNDEGKLLVVDLGMNAGDFAHEMLRRYSKSRVVAVEANPQLTSAIKPRPNLLCYNYAITSGNGPVRFGINLFDSTASSLKATGAGCANVVVEGIRFSDFMRKACIERELIDLLKIDIEGCELELFEQTSAQCFANVRQICVEFHAFSNPEHLPRITKIIARMESLGFHCVDFTTNFQDVLMVNKRLGLGRFGPIEMRKISLARYVRGAKRKLTKLIRFSLGRRRSVC
jgi:FkbM family methyltransferase